MNDASEDGPRHRMERALAALAGSGLDSTRFTVLLEAADGIGSLDGSMTAVVAVASGAGGAVLDGLDPTRRVAWVADAWAEPGHQGTSGTAGAPLSGWMVGPVGDLRDGAPTSVGATPGWLIVEAEAPSEATDAELLAAVTAAIEGGASPSRAAKTVAAHHGVPKRRVYDLTLNARHPDSPG